MYQQQDRFVFTRRKFIKMSSMGGVWMTTRRLASSSSDLGLHVKANSWSSSPGKARYRFEGLAKVKGDKIYARDFRFRDMNGWPKAGLHAMVLRSPSAGLTLAASPDLSGLPSHMRPIKTITSEDLERDGISFSRDIDGSAQRPEVGSLFAAVGKPVDFFGQPVAILLFSDYWTCSRARKFLSQNKSLLKFAKPAEESAFRAEYTDGVIYVPRLTFKAEHENVFNQKPAGEPTYTIKPDTQQEVYKQPTLLTRYSDGKHERFSQVLNGPSDPFGTEPVDLEAARWRQQIQDEIRSSGWKIIEANYETQQLDPMFMEPESGLAWLERSSSTLHMVIGTQSTDECVSDSISMFGAKDCAFKIASVTLNACYPGGGFGGRDVSTFSALIALAAAYADRPVRMAYDRFEQFQSGIKQLGSNINQRLAVDSKGYFQSIVSNYELLAGGRNNYSQWVAQLAGYCGAGGYVIPRVIIDAAARPSAGVIAGSMRGFGGPQSTFAVESLIDEAAIELKMDPIQLRMLNALSEGGHTVTGCKVSHSLRIGEICDRAMRNDIWINRDRDRQKYSKQGLLYGRGFGLANQAFGTGRDGVMASAELQRDGSVVVSSNCIDMGTGSATSLGISTKILGVNAKEVLLGQTSMFDVLKLTSDEREHKPDWKNPRYTPCVSLSSSSCITAFHQTHAVELACRVLMETSIWPLARTLWNLPQSTPFDASRVFFDNGSLRMEGHRSLSFDFICSELFTRGCTVAAMVHAAYLGQWIVSEFPIDGHVWRAPIDALAIRKAKAEHWRLVDRLRVEEPPDEARYLGRSLYSPSASLASVVVDPRTGIIKVQAVHSYLEAGRVIQPDLLMGQYHGGVAMGVGFAFHEYCPQLDGGPGEGDWNLHRYRVPRWKDLPLERITLELLEPASPDEPPRGIAEAVLCPVAPALSNAVGDATGKRFRSLPITADKILEALG